MNAVHQFTPEELAERANFIGGSDAAAAVGLNPYLSPFDLWQQKLGLAPHFAGNEATKWGKIHEAPIRQEYSERTGRVVRLPSDTMFHPKYGWMACHPDGVTDDRRLLEVKTARYEDGFGEEDTDEVPRHYLIQCQHSMLVLDLPVTDLAVLVGGSRLKLFEIPADRELQQLLVQAEERFVTCVVTRTAPELDATRKDAMQVVRRMYPGSTGEIVTADEIAIGYRADFDKASAAEKAAKLAKDTAKARMLAKMGEATFLAFPDGKSLRRAQQDRAGYTVAPTSFLDSRFVKS